MPQGGIRMAESAAKSYGFEVSDRISEIFSKYRKTTKVFSMLILMK